MHMKEENEEVIEIEAKLGLLVDKRTNVRVSYPSQSECILTDDGSYRFESTMTLAQHKHFNSILNGLATSKLVKYAHTKITDEFYNYEGRKVRVSVDSATGKAVACVLKQRIADINVWMPNSPLDYRISISVEIPATAPPPTHIRTLIREKDRISYIQEHCQVDLTKTTSTSDSHREAEISHECEVEYRFPKYLYTEKKKWESGEGHRFRELVGVMLGTVRGLSRKSITF